MHYIGKFLPKTHRSECYKFGRLPESERTGELPGHGALIHSTTPDIRHGVKEHKPSGEYMRRLNKMFNLNVVLTEDKVPAGSRKGREGKDLSSDPLFVGLRDMPVNPQNWYASEEEYADGKLAAKQQSKIAAFAKAGNIGTFKTRYRGNRLYICKTAAEYTKQKGE